MNDTLHLGLCIGQSCFRRLCDLVLNLVQGLFAIGNHELWTQAQDTCSQTNKQGRLGAQQAQDEGKRKATAEKAVNATLAPLPMQSKSKLHSMISKIRLS